jgi:hypothetical protein
MATVNAGHIKYYIDGTLVADHTGNVYPRQNMSIDFNQWFIDLTGHTGGTSTWHQAVDYVYHAKKQVLTPTQAHAAITAHRTAGRTHTDNVTAANDCDPGVPSPPPTTVPTTAPTTRPPTAPPTTAPTTAPPVGGTWAPGVAYTPGQVVTYGGKRYQCRQAHTSLVSWEPPNVLALWLPL